MNFDITLILVVLCKSRYPYHHVVEGLVNLVLDGMTQVHKIPNITCSFHSMIKYLNKMYSSFVFVLLVSVVSGFLLDTIGLGSSVPVVSELDVNKYLGRWFQMYTSQSVYATFERRALCVTADCKFALYFSCFTN